MVMYDVDLFDFDYLYSFWDFHPRYLRFKDQVKQIRDVLAGEERVKARTTKYLPKLTNQTTTSYNNYLFRAEFSNSTARIHSTNVGTIIRRSPTLEYDDAMTAYFKDDTNSSLSFRELMRFVVAELSSVSRVGVLVDINEDLNLPIPIQIKTESIVNWVKDFDGNLLSVALVVPWFEVSDDFKLKVDWGQLKNFKLYLSEGIYTIDEYDKNGNVISSRQPALNGKTLNFIPLVVSNSFGIDIEPLKCTLTDVAVINLSHYRTSADLETGRHFVGLPQPIITGGVADAKLYVGSDEAWVIPNDKAKAYYMEFLGQGLDGLARALKEKESQMSQFSAQLMDAGSKGSEAEGTVRMRFSSDAANLTTIAHSAEAMLNIVYDIIAKWLDVTEPTIELNKDFISDRLSYNELRELTKTWFDGGLSDEEFRYNLRRGEIIPNNKTLDSKNTSTTKQGEK